jgi:hypothetical protein
MEKYFSLAGGGLDIPPLLANVPNPGSVRYTPNAFSGEARIDLTNDSYAIAKPSVVLPPSLRAPYLGDYRDHSWYLVKVAVLKG